ncbi:MAG: hypothetical protein AB8F78_16500 [Saprospiraceae bacterium]
MILFRTVLCCFVLCAAFAKTSLAQVANPISLALGDATVAYTDVWGAAENPAVTSMTEKKFSAQAYGYSQLQLPDLNRLGVDLAYKAKSGHIQLGLQYFSPPGYTITGIHLGAGRQFSENLNAGIRVGILSGDYDEYGSEILPVAQVGLQYDVTTRLRAGAHYTYVDRAALPLAEHRLRVGVNYQSSDRVRVLVSAWQPLDNSLAGGLGLHYQAADRLAFNAGIRTGAAAFTFGVDAELVNGVRVVLGLAAYQELPLGVGYGVIW